LFFVCFVKQIITFNLNWLHNEDEVPIRRKSMQKHAPASETMYIKYYLSDVIYEALYINKQ